MPIVFHIATRAEWELAVVAGAYRTGSLEAEGFIHCSTAEQVAGTANRLFAGRISILRRDQRALFEHLAGWQLCAVVRSGVLEDWDGQTLPPAHPDHPWAEKLAERPEHVRAPTP